MKQESQGGALPWVCVALFSKALHRLAVKPALCRSRLQDHSLQTCHMNTSNSLCCILPGIQGKTGRSVGLPIYKPVLIEVAGGEHSYVGVHPVLHSQHVHWTASLLQPLKQTALEQQIPAPLGEHCRRQLLRVSHQDHPTEETTNFKTPKDCGTP